MNNNLQKIPKKYSERKPVPYREITGKERLKGRAEGYWQMDAQAQFKDDRRIGFFAANEVLNDL